jgi:HEPN domain-containing protein
MNRSARDLVGEGRSLLQEAALRMDEGEYRASAEACIRGSALVLEGMLRSWSIDPEDRRCRRMLETAGRETRGTVTDLLRESCRKIDRHGALYGDGEPAGEAVDEERAMELIHCGREVLRFVQRNLRREGRSDGGRGGD